MHPVKERTVNDNDVPNSYTTQTIHPVKERTVSDSDVPNSHTTQPIHPVQKSTNDRENKVTTQKPRDLKLNFEDFQRIDEHARKVKK